MKISPYVRMFFMPDAAAPAGGASPSATVAPAAPSSGKAAPPSAPPAPETITPAEAPAPKSAAQLAAEKEIEDFVPPPFDDDDEIKVVDPAKEKKPGQQDPPPPKPPEAKPGEQKAPEPPAAPGKNPEDDPKVAAGPLRKELAAVRKERDELKLKVGQPDPKIKELSDELEEVKGLNKAAITENDRFRSELAVHDPAAAAEVKKMETEYNADFEKRTRLMPKLRPVIGNLVGEFLRIPDGDPDNALAELRAKVVEMVGPDNAGRAMDLIQEGADFHEKYTAVKADVQKNGVAKQKEARQKSFDEGNKLMVEHLKGALDAPDDFRQAHPYHPLSYAQTLIAALPEAERAKMDEFNAGVDKYMLYASQGVSPAAEAGFAAMAPRERAAAMKEFDERRLEAVKNVRAMAKRGYFYEKVMTGILKQYAALREQVEKRTLGAPPSPNQPAGTGKGNANDIQNFEHTIPDDL